MKVYATAIKDKKADCFQAINISSNLENAKREFIIACQNQNSILSKFTSDFDFYLLAILDTSNPDLAFQKSVELLVSGDSVVKDNG